MARVALKDRIKALNAVYRLLKNGWTSETYALDNKGNEVDPLDPAACRFCIDGAMHRVCGLPAFTGRLTPLYAAIRNDVFDELDTGNYTDYGGNTFYSYVSYNDDQKTVEPVLKLLRNTVRKLKKRLERRSA